MGIILPTELGRECHALHSKAIRQPAVPCSKMSKAIEETQAPCPGQKHLIGISHDLIWQVWLSLPFPGTAGRKMFGFSLMNKHRRIDQMQGSTMLQLKYAHTDPFLLPQHRHSFTHQQPKTLLYTQIDPHS